MPWLHDNGDDNEYSQFEDEDGGKEGLIEETEEEVIITERPGAPIAPPPVSRPKPSRKASAKPKRKAVARAKARPAKKATAKKRPKAKAKAKGKRGKGKARTSRRKR
jgi:hypothetical protein